ncbi:MAG: DNA polymerase I, partial [Muribaculaceae bacterium]|nr:DNA polymerase I [Muribaculaceae bacterium]
MAEKRLFLLDAYALIFRAYYALIKMPRITQSGFNTSAIFGFVNTLEEVLRRENPSHIAVCFDPKGGTFRSEAYAEYKGEREATPEDIRLSIPYIKDIIRAYNIPILEVEGFEADDVIGTMATRAEREGFTTYMMTPDKDFGQLVSPSVLQYKPAYRGQDFELRGEEEVCGRYGLQSTRQVIDLLALMGDKVDNIPGCPGVGEKTAAKLIAEFGSVENLLESTSQLKGALKKKVEENAEQIRFSKFLATIRTDVPVDATPDDLARRSPDTARLREIFDSLEFRSLSDRVMRRIAAEEGKSSDAASPSAAKSEKPATETPLMGSLFDFDNEADEAEVAADGATTECASATAFDPTDIIRVADRTALDEMQRELTGAAEVGIHIVTSGDNDMTCDWIATALADADSKRVWLIGREFEEGVDALLDLFAREDIMKTTDAAKLIYVVAGRRRNDDATPLRNFYDISLAHYLLQPDMRHGLEDIYPAVCGGRLPEMPDLRRAKRARARRATADADSDGLATAAAARARAVLTLRPILAKMLKEEELDRLYTDIEAPLVDVLADMELTGVSIDTDALNLAAS